MTRITLRFALSVSIALLAACAGTPIETEHYYRAQAAPPPAHVPLTQRIIVEPFEVHGLYSGRPLIYVDAAGVYQQYNYQSWVESPAVMLGSDLLDTLRAAYGQDAAFSPSARIAGDLIVRSRLRRFERAQVRGATQAVLALEFTVTTPAGQLLGTVNFAEAAPVNATIADYVRGQSQLLTKAYAALLPVLDQQLILRAAK
ncbi:MAG: PqiC family protein [Nevskia sp.]|jgi:ABC-type uncharacterized transport system auxiliary subunit|nr:PqiC family protein [Nevskia sp.]